MYGFFTAFCFPPTAFLLFDARHSHFVIPLRGACKPASVRQESAGRPFISDCRCRQPQAPYPRVQAARTAPLRLFGFAPSRVYLASGIAAGAVGSYPAVSPLPACVGPGALFKRPNATQAGGLFSVALSLKFERGAAILNGPCSPPMGVTHGSVLWRPDFPRLEPRIQSTAVSQRASRGRQAPRND